MKNSPFLDKPLRTFEQAVRDGARARERGIIKAVISRLESAVAAPIIQRDDLRHLIASLREELDAGETK